MIDYISLGNNCEVGKICNYLNGNYNDKDPVHFLYRGLFSRQGENIDNVKFVSLFLKQCLDGNFSWVNERENILDGKPGWCNIKPLIGHKCRFVRHYEKNSQSGDNLNRHSYIDFLNIESYRDNMESICQYGDNPANNYIIQLPFNTQQRVNNIPMLMEQLDRINNRCKLHVLTLHQEFVKYSTDRVRFIPLKTHIGMVGTRFFTPEDDVNTLKKEFSLNMQDHPKLYSCGRPSEKYSLKTIRNNNSRRPLSKNTDTNQFMFG